MGSPITAYLITFKQSDSVYSAYTATCDGSSATIVNSLTCSVPISALEAAPFNLTTGSAVYAMVAAINSYGSSANSTAGAGATL